MDASRLLTKNTLPSVPLYTCILVPTVQSYTTSYGLYKTSKTARRANREPGCLRTGQRLCLCLSLFRASDSSLEGLVTGIPRDKGESTT